MPPEQPEPCALAPFGAASDEGGGPHDTTLPAPGPPIEMEDQSRLMTYEPKTRADGVTTVKFEDVDQRTFKLTRLEKDVLIIRALVGLAYEDGKPRFRIGGPAARAVMPEHVTDLRHRFRREGIKMAKNPIYLYTAPDNIVGLEPALRASKALALAANGAEPDELVQVSFVNDDDVYNFAGAHRSAAMIEWSQEMGKPAVWVANIMNKVISTEPRYWILFHSLATNRRELGREAQPLETFKMCSAIFHQSEIGPDAREPMLQEELGGLHAVRMMIEDPMARRVLSELADWPPHFPAKITWTHLSDLASGGGTEAILLALDLQNQFLKDPATTADADGISHPEMLHAGFWAALSVAYKRARNDRDRYQGEIKKALTTLWGPSKKQAVSETGLLLTDRILQWLSKLRFMWMMDADTLASEIATWKEGMKCDVLLEIGRWFRPTFPRVGPTSQAKYVDNDGNRGNRTYGLFYHFARVLTGGDPDATRDTKEWKTALLELLQMVNTASRVSPWDGMALSLRSVKAHARKLGICNPAAGDARGEWVAAFRYLVLYEHIHQPAKPKEWDVFYPVLRKALADKDGVRWESKPYSDRSSRVGDFLKPVMSIASEARAYMPLLMQEPLWFDMYSFIRMKLPEEELRSDVYDVPRNRPERAGRTLVDGVADDRFTRGFPMEYREELRDRLQRSLHVLSTAGKKSMKKYLLKEEMESLDHCLGKAIQPLLRKSALREWRIRMPSSTAGHHDEYALEGQPEAGGRDTTETSDNASDSDSEEIASGDRDARRGSDQGGTRSLGSPARGGGGHTYDLQRVHIPQAHRGSAGAHPVALMVRSGQSAPGAVLGLRPMTDQSDSRLSPESPHSTGNPPALSSPTDTWTKRRHDDDASPSPLKKRRPVI